MKHRAVMEWSDLIDQSQGSSNASYRASRTAVRTGNRTFYGAASWDDAVTMATGAGYRDALPEAETVAASVADTVLTDRLATTFEAHYDTAGAEVDVARFLSGEPECMVESVPLKIARRGRAVRIAVTVSARHDVPESTIRRRGAAVMALVDCLARAQHPLEVWAVQAIGHGDSASSIAVKVQDATAPLDEGRVMFALAHPAMLRRLIFSWEECQPADFRKTFGITAGGGYGTPQNAAAAMLPDADGTTIVLPQCANGQGWEDDDHVIKWVTDQLAAIFGDDNQ